MDTEGGIWVDVGGVRTCGTSDCLFFSSKLEGRASTENEDEIARSYGSFTLKILRNLFFNI